jgi:formate hydrogenlyase subunit 3/multisubunit Na+/H+ antiporter MnhD subunit
VIVFACALALLVLGGTAALVCWRQPNVSSALAVLGAVSAAVAGELVAIRGFSGSTQAFVLPWRIPYGTIHVAVDPLSAFFLVPIFGFGALAAIFGRSYFDAHPKPRHAIAWFAFNLLIASMACVVVARQAVFFLVAWEVMSLCAYVLVTVEHEQAEVRRAGWVYLIATHAATACLIALFLLLARHTGSFELEPARTDLPKGLAASLFALAIVGFGVKAGVVPLHVWLPEAHAAAPSHVSALMSGVLIKMGIYGLLRMLLSIGPPRAWWGPVLVLLGLAGALVGIGLALYQRDLKRVLAYSSIENVGIIFVGLGTGFWGLTSNRPEVAGLGITGALLHTWNHTLMKGLLFLGAGSILHATGTKDLEQLGGVMKRMPRTAIPMIAGAVSIAALPPMNGFVSEWLIYLGLAQGTLGASGATSVAASMAIATISFVGALTVLCFVRLIGIALLGQPRSDGALHAHESGTGMTWVLGVLAVLCAGAALSPHVLARVVTPVVTAVLGRPTDAILPTTTIALINGLLLAALVLGALAARVLVRARGTTVDATWGCGYAAPSVRMQYTGRSFAELMAERLLPQFIRPRVSVVSPSSLFPTRTELTSDCADPIVRGVYEPFLSRWGDRFMRLRWLQQGVLHAYIFYILVAVVGLLAWLSLRSWFA